MSPLQELRQYISEVVSLTSVMLRYACIAHVVTLVSASAVIRLLGVF